MRLHRLYMVGYGHVINMSKKYKGKDISTDPTLLTNPSQLRHWVDKHKQAIEKECSKL